MNTTVEIKIKDKVYEIPLHKYNEYMWCAQAISRFDNYNRCFRIRLDWINGEGIPELAKKFNTHEGVIKQAIIRGWTSMSIKKCNKCVRGTLEELWYTDHDLYDWFMKNADERRITHG